MERKTILLSGKKVVYTDVDIDWDGRKEVVRIKKLSFGEMLDLNQVSTKMSYASGQTQMSFDAKALSQECLLRSIIEAPFPVTLQGIRDLDKELGEKLVMTFNELNAPSEAKKDN